MKHQCLIASYAKDFIWLGPCLASLKKFSRGFLPPVISVASEDFDGAREVVRKHFPEATVVIKDGPAGKGNLRAQVSMMESDILCPHADFIWLVGSDCLAVLEFTPEVYCLSGQPIMLMNSYNHLSQFHAGTLPWRTGVTNALGFQPDFEYMRRLPILYPRDVFRATRAHIEWLHKKTFEEYVYSVGNGVRSDSSNFSESNVLGAYAHRFMPGAFRWVDIDGAGLSYADAVKQFPNLIVQFWSHGGLDKLCDKDLSYCGNGKQNRTPREVITEILGPGVL